RARDHSRPPPQIESVTIGLEVRHREERLAILVLRDLGGDAGVRLDVDGRARAVAVDLERQRAAVVETDDARVERGLLDVTGEAALDRFAALLMERLIDREVLR